MSNWELTKEAAISDNEVYILKCNGLLYAYFGKDSLHCLSTDDLLTMIIKMLNESYDLAIKHYKEECE